MPYAKRIAMILNQRRKELELTGYDIARAIDMDHSTVYRYLRGDIKRPQIDILARFCDVLGLDLSDLLK